MGFSNIGKHKYSWVLNIIRYVYLKVGRLYLNKIMCDKKKKKKVPKQKSFLSLHFFTPKSNTIREN